MQSVIYRRDLSACSLAEFQQDVDKYAGNIRCPECEAAAWFVSGSTGGLRERSACFAAHHKERCQIKTVILVADGEVPGTVDGEDNAHIVVDLDKRKSQTILTPAPPTTPPVDSPWGSIQKQHTNAADYPVNKSLRQILSRLTRNPDYPEDETNIRITADNGRVVLEGSIRRLLFSQYQLSDIEPGSVRLFWGQINNINRKDGSAWLNCGDYLSEPSILIRDKDLEDEMLSSFKLSDLNDLAGARFIMVGHLSGSAKKKILNFAFSKYIAFVKYRIKDDN